MKKIVMFVFITLLIILKYQVVNAADLRLVNEINDVSINKSQSTLEIKGWGFIQDAQNYYGPKTHSYTLTLKSNQKVLKVEGTPIAIDHTETMNLMGVRYCTDSEINKSVTFCNNYYKNIGFTFSVPLSKLDMNENYVVSLTVHAKNANLSRTQDVYFPNKEALSLKNGKDNYVIDSKLHNINVKILDDFVYARKEIGHSTMIHQSKKECNYNSNLYFEKNTKFMNVFNKQIFNNTTYYQVSGTETICRNNRIRIKEGNDLNPVWIASTFIEHIGEALTIKTRQVNEPPIIIVTHHPTLYINDKLDVFEGVSAKDFEGVDLTSEIKVVENTYQNKVGSYHIRYSVQDKYGDTSYAVKNIAVLRKNYPPVIIANDIEIEQFSPFNPIDYVKAFDQDDEDIINRVIAPPSVNTDIVKEYIQCYEVSDKYLLKSEKCIKVNVIKAQSALRFIQQKRLFYLEHIPKFWQGHESRLRDELLNDIIYDSYTLSK